MSQKQTFMNQVPLNKLNPQQIIICQFLPNCTTYNVHTSKGEVCLWSVVEYFRERAKLFSVAYHYIAASPCITLFFMCLFCKRSARIPVKGTNFWGCLFNASEAADDTKVTYMNISILSLWYTLLHGIKNICSSGIK